MVHIPVRGELPARLGPSVQALPKFGPSVMTQAFIAIQLVLNLNVSASLVVIG